MWEYASVPVEVIFDSLSHIDSVYCINSTNAGFVSFKPNQSFNTLQLLESYKTYIVVLKSASYTINYSQPIVQLDKPKTGYVSGNVDLIEYLGSNTNISLLPQDFLDKLKTIYSLNSTGNGFISYNTSSPFNTLSQLKNNSILIVEKTNNQTITFFDTQTDFPNSSRPDVSGPKYCSYPDVWRISSDNEYYCYNPDVNNVDIADVEPSIEELFLPLQNNASLIDVQDCPGDQKLGLIALNGDNRFVDFAECGDYVDLPIEVPDLSTLQGGTVFETLTAMKVTALNHLLKNVSNQLSTINSSLNIISRQINSLDRQLTKLSNDLDDNWQAYIALQTSLNDETDSQNISDIQTLIGQKQNIINQIQQSIETKNITRQNSQNVFNNLSNEATSLNEQQNNIKSAISNPALTNTLFPEIDSPVLSSISDATNGMGFVSPIPTTPYAPIIGSYCLNNQCVSGSYDDWEAAVNINPIQSIGQWVPENCSAAVQCVGNSREFSILSDNTCSNPTLKISGDGTSNNLSIKTKCPSSSSFYGNDLWLACQVNGCGSSDTSTVLVTVSSIGSNNLPSNYYVTATGGVRQGSSDSGVITLGSLSGSGNAFSIPVTYCCAKSPGSVSVPITFRAIDNTTGKILGRSEIRVVGTAEKCNMDGRYETGPCCHEFTPGIRTCGIVPYEICYTLTGNEKSFLKPDFDYFPSANNGKRKLVPTRIQKTCDDFDPSCGTTTAGPCPCPNSVDTAWFGTRCSCKTKDPFSQWYPCVNGCTLYDSQGNVISRNGINKGVCLTQDQINNNSQYEWYPGGSEGPCGFRCKPLPNGTLPNIKSCQDDTDFTDGIYNNVSAYFFNFKTCGCECNPFRLEEPCPKGNLDNYLQFHPTDTYRVILGTIGKPKQLQKEKPNTYPKEKFSKNFGDKTGCDCQCMFLQGNDYVEGSQSVCEELLQSETAVNPKEKFSNIEFSTSVCACSAKKLGACCDRFSNCYNDKTSTQCDEAGDIWHINKTCDEITCEPTTTTTTTTTPEPELVGTCCKYNNEGTRISCDNIWRFIDVSLCEDDPCGIFSWHFANLTPRRDCQDRTNPFYADEDFYCPETKLLPSCGTTLPPVNSCCLTWVPCPNDDNSDMTNLFPINICADDPFGIPNLNSINTCNANYLNNPYISSTFAEFYSKPANQTGVTWTAYNVQFKQESCNNSSCTTPSPAFSCLEKEIVTNVSVFNVENVGLGASNNEKLQTPQIIIHDGQPSILIEVTLAKIRATGNGIVPTPQGLGQEISASIDGEGNECCKTPVLNIESDQNKSYVGYSIISNRTISEFIPVNDCPS